MKKCAKCFSEKSLEQFSNHKGRKDGKQPFCKECMTAYKRANSEKHNAYNREWHRRNPDNLVARSNRRRALVLGCETEKYSKQDIIDVYGSNCHICSEEINLGLRFPHPLSFTREHVVPLARGGSDTIANVKPAHLVCNQKKRDRVDAASEVC